MPQNKVQWETLYFVQALEHSMGMNSKQKTREILLWKDNRYIIVHDGNI
jgi:hypothetical protein